MRVETVESVCGQPDLGPKARAWCTFMEVAVANLPKPTRRTTLIRRSPTETVNQRAVEHYGALAITRPVHADDGRMLPRGYKVTHTRTGVSMQLNDVTFRRRGTARRYLAGLASIAEDLLCVDDAKNFGAQAPEALRKQIAALNRLAAPSPELEYAAESDLPIFGLRLPRPAHALRRCDPDSPIGSQVAIEGLRRR